MKTGFLYGNARIPKFRYYYYHGKILQCRKEPWIPPYIYYDTHPAIIPPNYYFECDTEPQFATPPMEDAGARYVHTWNADGLWHVRTVYSGMGGMNYISKKWSFTPTSKLEITCSVPIFTLDWCSTWFCPVIFLLQILGAGSIKAERDYRWRDFHTELRREWTEISGGIGGPWTRPFTTEYHVFFEKILGTNKWHFYFNDEWFFDIENPALTGVRFYLQGGDSNATHFAMDYLRAWKDT